jgi:hypothetical protein
VAVVRDHDVGGLEVPVDDALVVRSSHRPAHLGGDLEVPGQGHPSPPDEAAQVRPPDPLHGDEGHAVGFVDLVDDTDVRVLQLRGGLRLLDEPPLALGIGDELRGEDLDGDLAVQLQVRGAVDDAHASPADLFEDAVVRKRPADQGGSPVAGERASARNLPGYYAASSARDKRSFGFGLWSVLRSNKGMASDPGRRRSRF